MSFEATLFNPLTGDSTKVSVRTFGSSLEVTDASTEALRVDPGRCELKAGGWDHGSLQIVWPGEGGNWAISSTDPAAKEELARIPRFQDALRLASRAQKGARRRGHLGLTLVAILTLLPAIAVGLVFLFRDTIVDAVLTRIPITVDGEVGKMFEGQILGSKDEVAENDATRAIQTIVDRLKTADSNRGFEFKVSVQRNKDVNAFAAPGGLIVVYTGLINEAASPEEVAGVLAHEMAHVTKRHSMRQLIYAGGVLPLVGLLIGQPDAAALVQNLGQLSELRFSRSQEEVADLTGFETLVIARVSTEGMARFFDRLAKIEGGAPSFLSTHPSSVGRAEAIRARAKSFPAAPAAPFDIDWAAVKASIR